MKASRLFCCGFLCASLLLAAPSLHADPVIRAGSSLSQVDIQQLLDLFTMDLNGAYTSVDWDSVPDDFASPNPLPPDYFSVTDALGLNLSTPGTGLFLSADSDNPTGTPSGFADIDPSYQDLFQVFSAERLFTTVGSTELEVSFSDSSGQAATVTGFGAVFSGVDQLDSTYIEFFDSEHNSLATVYAPPSASGGLSFLGVSFDGGERVGSVVINSGNTPLASGVAESGNVDLVALDNIVFSNPVPEPSALVLLSVGALGFLAVRRFRR